MNNTHADSLAEFVHDHDKRYSAKAEPSGDQSVLLLTQVADGQPLPVISSYAEYETLHINTENPGPTVRIAWEKWRQTHTDK